MALEAVVFQQDLFGHSTNKELYNLAGGNWCQKQEDKDGSFHFLECSHHQSDFFLHGDWSPSSSSLMLPFFNNDDQLHLQNPSSSDTTIANGLTTPPPAAAATNNTSGHHDLDLDHDFHQLGTPVSTTPATRAKRRRSRTRKNKEEIENQRMTHIAVERNRRKQMNEYLCVLRSLMPESYVQRGDQASIIGGAINFVKELEQRLQVLGAHKESTKEKSDDCGHDQYVPFSEFFTFPQYSTASICGEKSAAAMSETIMNSEAKSCFADIEVTMVESHANLKIRSKRRPKQLLKVVSGLHSLRFTILHLNVTTIDQTVLYSLSVKIEDDCKLTSVDEIATAVNQMLGRIQEESTLMK